MHRAGSYDIQIPTVVNIINNRVDDNDDILICKQGQSHRALHQWQVHKRVSILRETRSLERQTMLGGRSLSRFSL